MKTLNDFDPKPSLKSTKVKRYTLIKKGHMIVQVKTGVDHIVRISCKNLSSRDSHLGQTILHSNLKTF